MTLGDGSLLRSPILSVCSEDDNVQRGFIGVSTPRDNFYSTHDEPVKETKKQKKHTQTKQTNRRFPSSLSVSPPSFSPLTVNTSVSR